MTVGAARVYDSLLARCHKSSWFFVIIVLLHSSNFRRVPPKTPQAPGMPWQWKCDVCLFANTEKNGKSFKKYFKIGKNTLKDRPNAIKGSCFVVGLYLASPEFPRI
jgi:hypothetical protein